MNGSETPRDCIVTHRKENGAGRLSAGQMHTDYDPEDYI